MPYSDEPLVNILIVGWEYTFAQGVYLLAVQNKFCISISGKGSLKSWDIRLLQKEYCFEMTLKEQFIIIIIW